MVKTSWTIQAVEAQLAACKVGDSVNRGGLVIERTRSGYVLSDVLSGEVRAISWRSAADAMWRRMWSLNATKLADATAERR